MEEKKKAGSGLHLQLRAGEEVHIKGTQYYVKNTGSFTASLQIFTEEYKEQRDSERRHNAVKRHEAFTGRAGADEYKIYKRVRK